WADASTQPAAALQASGFTLDASALALPFEKPFPFKGSLGLEGSALAFEGEASDRAAQVRLTVDGFPLTVAAPYLAQALNPALDGTLGGSFGLQWDASAASTPGATGLKLAAGPLALQQLALRDGKTALASVSRIDLEDAQVDLDARSVAIARLAITGPQVDVE